MSREFWFGVLVGCAFCVVIAGVAYGVYLWRVNEIQKRWNDPYDQPRPMSHDAGYGRDYEDTHPPTVNRDPLAPPFPPQAAGDPTESPVVHDIRWSRRAPRND